jgi:membrane protein DedA with SNARE-associated domain
VTSFFEQQGLPLLFAAVAIESVGIPVPGETALTAFGVLAAMGHYPIEVVIAVAATAAVVGDNLGFWLIGRRGGRALVSRYPWVKHRADHVLPRAEALIDRYGGRAVFFGRFVSVLRESIAWVAGLAGMSWPRFLFWNAFGGIVWATGVGLLAYFGGKALAETVSHYGLYAGAAVVFLVAAFFLGRQLIARSQLTHGPEVNVMFEWMQWRRSRLETAPVPDAAEVDRDSGEEEYASHEEDAREVAPSGMTRVKTDNI